jgi:hypothetical protein
VATHYDVLGVRADAPSEDLRRAYLDRARELHPDRAVTGPSGDAQRTARRMQDVNEAWRVLRDPKTRAAYDEALSARQRVGGPSQPTRSAPPSAEDEDDLDTPFSAPMAEPGDLSVSLARAIPWVAILVVLAAIFVFTAFAAGNKDDDRPSDLVGRCVSSGDASAVVAVPCAGPNEGRVVLVVDRASLCPGTATSRAIEGDKWLCLEPVDGEER